MTQTMLAAVLPAPGMPLEVERIPVPGPRRGEILVKVAACGVCHTDLHVIKGEVAFPTPAVLGHEISGTVVELGEGVAGPAVGSRVIGTFIMPCGSCPACTRPRRHLRAVLLVQPPARDALRRRDTAVPPGRLAARDVLDGRPGGVRGRPGDCGLRSPGEPVAGRGGRARMRGPDRLRRRHATAPICVPASAWQWLPPAVSGR